MDDPRMEDFVTALDPVNASADAHEGFVWRLASEPGDDPELDAFESSGWLVNLSVWRDLESLRDFVTSAGHLQIMKRRAEWFEKQQQPTMVLWWVNVGHIPPFKEAIERLRHLRQHGAGPRAFHFAKPFPSP